MSYGIAVYLFAIPSVSFAATEFVSIVDPGQGADYDYPSLSAWEGAVQSDLTVNTTKVFPGTRTGTLTDNATMYLCRGGAYQTVTANRRHATATQILAQTISNGSFVFQAGDIWYTNNTCNSAAYFTISDAGDSAIAVAKCRTTNGAADIATVNIEEWTTSDTNYIKIWTDPGENYRHQGHWDVSKYRLEPSTGYAIIAREEYVRVDGLQIAKSATAAAVRPMTSGTSEIWLSNNLIKGNSGDWQEGFYWAEAGSNSIGNIYNNIFYDFSAPGAEAIQMNNSNITAYIYSNSLIDNTGGIYVSAPGTTVIAKNNIVKGSGNANAYVGTFASGTDYNATDGTDAIGEGSNNRISQTFTFLDEANDDFHLASSDTGAKNFGTGQVSEIGFSTDIDGESRPSPAGGSWDIGADERPTDNVYYSVGQSTADLSNNGSAQTCTVGGDCTVTISSGTATFNFSQTGNIGVGDRVTYNTSSIAYISGKVSATQWTLVTATGGTPANVTGQALNSITREYTTLSAAEAGATDSNHLNTANLVTGNYQLNFPCYYDTGADTTAVVVDGWTTGENNYIRIYTPSDTQTEANQSQRHNGKWDESKYRLEISTDDALEIHESYVRVDGLQVYLSTGNHNAIYIYGGSTSANVSGETQVSNNIVKGDNVSEYQQGIYFYYIATHTAKVWNNITYNFSAWSGDGIFIYDVDCTAYVYNNTSYHNRYGIVGLLGTVIAKNNVSYNNTDNWNGVFSASGVNNLSGPGTDVDMPTINAQDGIAVSFVSTVSGSEDLHLASADTGATKHGANLSNDTNLEFAVDIDNETRVGTWDIGADEASLSIAEVNNPDLPPPANKMTVNMSLTDKMTDGLVGMWSFDGPDVDLGTNTAYDRSPVGTNHGTISGATLVRGKKGSALDFDGATSYINAGSGSSLDDIETQGGGGMTVSAWIKPRTNGETGTNCIVCKDREASTSNGAWSFEINASYGLVFTKGFSATRLFRSSVNDVVPQNTWKHALATWNGSDNYSGVHIYINGVETSYVTNQSGSGDKNSEGSGNLYIGNDIWGGRTIDGVIDDVRIYNRILSSDEISDLYRLGQASISR